VQDSTIDYYHERRTELMARIAGETVKKIDVSGGEVEVVLLPCCDKCGQVYDPECDEFHFHHVDGNDKGERRGGWQHFYRVKDEFEEGVELSVLCRGCHAGVHLQRGDLDPLSNSFR